MPKSWTTDQGLLREVDEAYQVSSYWRVVSRRKASRDALIYRLSLLGWTQREIGEVFGLARRTISDIGEKFIREVFANVKREFAGGKPIEEIAGYHGLDRR